MNIGVSQNQINDPNMKQIFQNNEITLSSSITRNNENMSGCFYVSNNTQSYLNNVKVNFMVPKYITLKVSNTTGTSLEGNRSLGIKKVTKKLKYQLF